MCNPDAPALCQQYLWPEPSLQDGAGEQKGLQAAGPPRPRSSWGWILSESRSQGGGDPSLIRQLLCILLAGFVTNLLGKT